MWFKKKGQAVVENITNISKTYPELKYKVTISMDLDQDEGGGIFEFGLLFAIFALLAGSVANKKSQLLNQKTFLENQETFLSNQLRIEDKLDVVLENLEDK